MKTITLETLSTHLNTSPEGQQVIKSLGNWEGSVQLDEENLSYLVKMMGGDYKLATTILTVRLATLHHDGCTACELADNLALQWLMQNWNMFSVVGLMFHEIMSQLEQDKQEITVEDLSAPINPEAPMD